MLAVFIHILEITLFSLLALLIYRVRFLSLKMGASIKDDIETVRIIKRLTHGAIKTNAEYEIKMDSLKKSQAFAGIQLLEIKRAYGNLHQENLAWMREAISLYLIGAIDLIGKQASCGAQSRKELIELVLKSNLKLSSDNSAEYFKEALYRKLSSDNDLMVRAGAKAAKIWLTENTVPNEMSLSRHLNDWGVFA